MCLQCSAYKWCVCVMLWGCHCQWKGSWNKWGGSPGWTRGSASPSVRRPDLCCTLCCCEGQLISDSLMLLPVGAVIALLNDFHRLLHQQELTAIRWLPKLFLDYLDCYLSIHMVNNYAWVILILLLPIWDGYIRKTSIWSHFSSCLMLQVSVGSYTGILTTNGVSSVRFMHLHSVSMYVMI